MITLWIDGETLKVAVQQYVERNIIQEGQHVCKVSGASQSVQVTLKDTMEELAK